jgi:hypothetical protein
MTNFRLGLVGLLGATGIWLAGCGSNTGGNTTTRPIDSTEATSTVNARVESLLAGLGDSAARLDTTGGTSVATGSVNSALGSSSACPGNSSDTTGSATGAVDDAPKSTAKGLDDFLHRVAKEAKEHVFRKEFIESEDGNQVIYKIDPTSACGAWDSDCVQKLTANPVRFVVTANTDDSLNVALLVGEARHNPGTAVLGQTKLSARVNLAEVMDTIRLFVAAEKQKDLPEMHGALQGMIEKRGENDFAISASVLAQSDLLVGQSKGKPVSVTMWPSDPTWQVTLDANTNTLGYSVNLGAVDVKVAGAAVCNDKCGSKERTGTFAGYLGGATGAVTVSKGATELAFTDLGLGNATTYVALDGDRLGTLDVNPNNGRKFSMSFKKTAEGTLVTFEPALDIKLALMLNKLSESLRVDMPDWLSDQIFDVMLGGAAKPQVLVPAPTCDAYGSLTTKSQLEVVSGDLTLTAKSPQTRVEVSAGMCLLPASGVDRDANPVLKVKAGSCQ